MKKTHALTNEIDINEVRFDEIDMHNMMDATKDVMNVLTEHINKFDTDQQPLVVNNVICSVIATLYQGNISSMIKFMGLIEHSIRDTGYVTVEKVTSDKRLN